MVLAAAFFFSTLVWASFADLPFEDSALAFDDECSAAATPDEQQLCALNALQLRGAKASGTDMKTEAHPGYAKPNLQGPAPPPATKATTTTTTTTTTTWPLGVAFLPPVGEYNLKEMGPPNKALDYKGLAWPTKTIRGLTENHVFAIGDWGGMDGSLNPIEGRPRVIAYTGGHTPGPHIFPRSRYNLHHTRLICNHTELLECFQTAGQKCNPECGYINGIDTQGQQLVANSFRMRAMLSNPAYILNVGDNFYWGGIEKTCATSPMSELSYTAQHQFAQVWEGMYNGPGLDNKPWISVLGNHDWGGRVFTNGWDQQIAYTWKSNRWVLPAHYYSWRVEYPDLGFNVDYFMLDSNQEDAQDYLEDPEHNICGTHNSNYTSCARAGGPDNVTVCKAFFWNNWAEQMAWLEQKLTASTATWQIVVTHFPCGFQTEFFRRMYKEAGLDLLVTGHRHDQELWDKGSRVSDELGGLTCFVTGGGGGITSEASPGLNHSQWAGEAQYGFYDLTLSKNQLLIESINYDGLTVKSAKIYPH